MLFNLIFNFIILYLTIRKKVYICGKTLFIVKRNLNYGKEHSKHN